jgi:hypothetical protein
MPDAAHPGNGYAGAANGRLGCIFMILDMDSEGWHAEVTATASDVGSLRREKSRFWKQGLQCRSRTCLVANEAKQPAIDGRSMLCEQRVDAAASCLV